MGDNHGKNYKIVFFFLMAFSSSGVPARSIVIVFDDPCYHPRLKTVLKLNTNV